MSINAVPNPQDYYAVNSIAMLSAPNALAGQQISSLAIKASESENADTAKKHVSWGANDNTPNSLLADIKANTVLTSGIRLNAKILYGGGVSYGNISVAEGKRDWAYAYDLTVEKWLKASNFAKQLLILFYDLSAFGNAYILFTKSIDGSKISRVSVNHTRAIYTRLNEVNKYGEHTSAFVNPDMGTSFEKKENTVEYKVAPEFDTAYWVKHSVPDGGSFILPQKIVDGGSQVYSTPDWNSARESNWLNISKSIAVLNKAMLENSLRPLWHIEIHPDFWPALVGPETWNTLKNDVEQRKSVIDGFHKNLSDKLMGAENAGCYIATPMMFPVGMPENVYSLVKITALENKLLQGKDGFYLTTSREASQHLVVSMGLDSAMMGTIPGDGGMGAGSGSNNRVAFNQRALLSKSDQDIYLNFMYMVGEVNGWKYYDWLIDQGLITTLDSGAETEKINPQVEATNNI